MVLIFCAPSGSGKSTFVKHLLETYTNRFELSISATSRPLRGTEQHGVEYYFLSVEEFRELIKNDQLLEYQEVYENKYYGSLKSEVERIEANGHHIVFDVDVLGGLNIKKYYGDKALSIFVEPPSIEELRRRLEGRQTDSKEMIEERLAKANYELSFAPQFDVRIKNDKLSVALAELDNILKTKGLI